MYKLSEIITIDRSEDRYKIIKHYIELDLNLKEEN
jgi:hypothetical protein